MSVIKLLIQLILSIPFIIVFLGALLFIPANSLDWSEGWIFIFQLVAYIGFTYFYFIFKDPETLQKRGCLSSSSSTDVIFLIAFGIDFLILLILPGFDYQYDWSQLPEILKWIGFLGLFLSYVIVFLVMRENSFASKGLMIHKEQEVITSGPYSVVRHPMYVGFIIMSFCIPLALGSLIAILPALLNPIFLARRIRNEEKMLITALSGYLEYMEKVPYRLIPKIW